MGKTLPEFLRATYSNYNLKIHYMVDDGYDIKYCSDLDKMLHDLVSWVKMDKYVKVRPPKKRKHLDEGHSKEDDYVDTSLKGILTYLCGNRSLQMRLLRVT